MLKQILCLALAGLLVNLAAGASPVHAASKDEEQARFAEQVKAGVAKLGTGADARVEVRLRDKTKLKGYVSEAAGEHFVVADPKTGAATAVAYSQVKQVRRKDRPTGVDAAITIGGVFGLLIVVGLLIRASED